MYVSWSNTYSMSSNIGSCQECIFNLMTFGIPRDALPFNMETGKAELRAHHAWLDMVRAREQAVSKPEGPSSGGGSNGEIVTLGTMDIIVGRGSHSRSSVGYLRLRNLVQDHYEQYEKAGRTEKTSIAKKILQESKAAGCRFVRFTPEGLVECDEGQSREKISHTFRNMRHTSKTEQKKGEKRGHCPTTPS